MKSIIYVRTSTQEQNPENQLNDCQALSNSLGLECVGVIEDKQSAWKDNIEREGFTRVKILIKQKDITALICWDLDRLFRNRKKLVEFFQYCKNYNVKIYSSRQDWLENLNKIQEPFNEIMFNLMLEIMGWLAEEESNKKSARVKSAIRIKSDGVYSYKGNRWGRKQISTQKKNKIIELRNEGLSIRAICKELNLSIGVVHKTITGLKQEKPPK